MFNNLHQEIRNCRKLVQIDLISYFKNVAKNVEASFIEEIIL